MGSINYIISDSCQRKYTKGNPTRLLGRLRSYHYTTPAVAMLLVLD